MPQAAVPAVSGSQMMIGLALGVFLLIFLVLKTKVHAFPALIIAASVTGLVGGMAAPAVAKSISNGFGSTLGSIGIVIGFGVMMGRILEVSGAAEKMAYTFLKYLGKKKEEWALALTGYMVSIPIFVDSGFVILMPLVKALSRKTKKSAVTLGISLAIGLAATHHLVPPTPGPLGAAGIFKADLGAMILWGMVFAIPVVIAGVLYAMWLGKKIYTLPDETGMNWERPQLQQAYADWMQSKEEKNLPSTWISFAPIIVPVLLILANTVLAAMKATGLVADAFIFLGTPIIATGIGLLIAIYGLTGRDDKKEVLKRMEEGVTSAGIIILVTGGGGALGQVLRDSGAGDYMANLIAQTALPAILLPFVIATLVRLIQGSGTVAMITASSIAAPILANMNVNPVFAAQSAAMGAFVFSYFNDSLFWVVNRMLGIEDTREQLKVWSVPTTIAWATSLVSLLVANAFFG
ncbi:GntP family permease [Heliophilum fasciatum]|uniref:GntP family gluconate:H+ symporter n=1 Tax=Heliophilum fasciatum TaxID=35700 RepID=A0A4R2RW53_9FIRM|nr:gluconate:H+ symporter [Heliophilum fasciatum]MCW2276867.1 GntP family gluconate:H+ symporter [Heliophilum fasciatum]TCP68672.1 GntP family gluconate:H+ symporter [Heliophilum fasciatum]